MPINELNIVLIRNFPLKFERPKNIAIGIPQRAAIKVAEPETNNDRSVISVILGSPEKMSWSAFNRPSNMFIRFPASTVEFWISRIAIFCWTFCAVDECVVFYPLNYLRSRVLFQQLNGAVEETLSIFFSSVVANQLLTVV